MTDLVRKSRPRNPDQPSLFLSLPFATETDFWIAAVNSSTVTAADILCDSAGAASDDDDSDDADSPLRPDLYCLDHDRRVVIPIEFTVADDANLNAAIGRKHAEYDPWLS